MKVSGRTSTGCWGHATQEWESMLEGAILCGQFCLLVCLFCLRKLIQEYGHRLQVCSSFWIILAEFYCWVLVKGCMFFHSFHISSKGNHSTPRVLENKWCTNGYALTFKRSTFPVHNFSSRCIFPNSWGRKRIVLKSRYVVYFSAKSIA